MPADVRILTPLQAAAELKDAWGVKKELYIQNGRPQITHLSTVCLNFNPNEPATVQSGSYWEMGVKSNDGLKLCHLCFGTSLAAESREMLKAGAAYSDMFKRYLRGRKENLTSGKVLSVHELCIEGNTIALDYIQRERESYKKLASVLLSYGSHALIKSHQDLLQKETERDALWKSVQVQASIEAFADRYADRIAEIRENKPNHKRYQYFYDSISLPSEYTTFILPLNNVDLSRNFFGLIGAAGFLELGWVVAKVYGTTHNEFVYGQIPLNVRNLLCLPENYLIPSVLYTEEDWQVMTTLIKDGIGSVEAAKTALSLSA